MPRVEKITTDSEGRLQIHVRVDDLPAGYSIDFSNLTFVKGDDGVYRGGEITLRPTAKPPRRD